MGIVPVFFCGPHCGGKTSILRDLYKEGIISEYGSEIGKDLFYQRHIDTALQGEDFEKEITNMEISRDNEYSRKQGVIGIESWHPGNLAYAMIRNPDIVPELIKSIKKSPILSLSYGICFCVSRDNIFLRTKTFRDNPRWAADFYTQIGSCLNECLRYLELTERCVCIDADRPYNDVYMDAKLAVNLHILKSKSFL